MIKRLILKIIFQMKLSTHLKTNVEWFPQKKQHNIIIIFFLTKHITMISER